jgi:DNA-binding beta-propeller fold protein YncE
VLKSNLHYVIRASLFCVVACLPSTGFCQRASTQDQPHYKVDPFWPKELPNNWIVGQIGGMAVDRNNHIWVLQRPRSNTPDEIGADPSSPRGATCCIPAPPVLVFDTEGNLLKSWGGPGEGYDWPNTEHGIFVDRNGNVYIGGNGATDRQVLKFTNGGKFLKQVGHPSKAPADSADTTLLGRPAGVEVDDDAHELYVADGYLNKRVIVFDSDTLAFKRMWGGYGNAPSDVDFGPYKPNASPDQQFRSPVHCAHISRDGLVYVCDRTNDRIQVFTKQGKFVKEFFVRPETPATFAYGTVCDIAFSRDPGQAYLLVADVSNNVIWTLRRSDGTVLGMLGHQGRNAGQFQGIHELVSDSAGNLYSGEVGTGNRIQKFGLLHRKLGPQLSRRIGVSRQFPLHIRKVLNSR